MERPFYIGLGSLVAGGLLVGISHAPGEDMPENADTRSTIEVSDSQQALSFENSLRLAGEAIGLTAVVYGGWKLVNTDIKPK